MANPVAAQTRLALQPVPAKVFVQVVGFEDEFEGKLIGRDADSVTFTVDARTYTFPLSRVTKIDAQGRRRTGVGAISGALIGGLAGALCFYCAQGGSNGSNESPALGLAIDGAIIGSVIGFFRHDLHTIYRDPPPAPASRQTTAPSTVSSKRRILKGALLGFGAGALLGAAPWSQEACNQRWQCVIKGGVMFGLAGAGIARQ